MEKDFCLLSSTGKWIHDKKVNFLFFKCQSGLMR
jgi:hypothetical protein